MRHLLKAFVFIAAAITVAACCCEKAEAATAYSGYPSGYTDVDITTSPDTAEFKDSILGLSVKSDEEIRTGDLATIFPAIEAYKVYILKKSDPNVKERMVFAKPVPGLPDKLNVLMHDNPGFVSWFDGLTDAQKRNLSLYLGWNNTFTRFYAQVKDFEDNDILRNVINTNVFADWVMKDVVSRLKVSDEQIAAWKENAFSLLRGKAVVAEAWQTYFLTKVNTAQDNTEALALLKDELAGLMREIDLNSVEQIQWINKLRFLLKIRSEISVPSK